MRRENQVQMKRNKRSASSENSVVKKSSLMRFLRKRSKTPEMPDTRPAETYTHLTNSSNYSETELHPSQSFPSIERSPSSSCTRSSDTTKYLYKKATNKALLKRNRKIQALLSKSLLNSVPTASAFSCCQIESFSSNIEDLHGAIDKLYRSEEHVLDIIKKYISDEQLKKKLLEASSVYFGLQNNAKSQALVLVNSNLQSQIESDKSQRKILQDNVGVLVQQNRSLQEEIETVYRNCEKMSLKFLSRQKNQQAVGRVLMKNIVSNNRNLHGKVKAMGDIIQVFEEKTSEMQRRIGEVESEKRNVEKDLEQVLETSENLLNEHELERTALKKQVEKQTEQLKAVSSAGSILIEELATYERQITSMPFSLNWPKLRLESDEPLEIIDKCKSCVQELVRALITTNTNATILARDANKLRETNARLQGNLRKSTDELDSISRSNLRPYDPDLESLTAELERMKEAWEESHASLVATKAEKRALSEELQRTKDALSEAYASNKVTKAKSEALIEELNQTKDALSEAYGVQEAVQAKAETLSEELERTKSALYEAHASEEALKVRSEELEQTKNALGDACSTIIAMTVEATKVKTEPWIGELEWTKCALSEVHALLEATKADKQNLSEELEHTKNALDDAYVTVEALTLEATKTKTEPSTAELEQTKDALEEAYALLENSKGNMETLRRELEHTKDALDEVHALLEATRADKNNLSEELEHTKDALGDAYVTVEALTLETTKTKTEPLTAELEQTKDALEEAYALLEESKANMETLNRELEQTKNDLSDAYTTVEALTLEATRSKTQPLTAELEQTKDALEEAYALLEDTKANMETLSRELEHTKEALGEAYATVGALTLEASKAKTDLTAELEQTKDAYEGTCTLLEGTRAEKETLTEELGQTKYTLGDAYATIEALTLEVTKARTEHLTAQLNRTEEALEEANASLEATMAEKETLAEELGQTKYTLEDAYATIEALTLEVTSTKTEALAEELAQTKDALCEAYGSQEATRAKAETLTEELQRTSDALDGACASQETAKAEAEALAEELERTKNTLGEAYAAVDALTHDQTCLRNQIEDVLRRVSGSSVANFGCGDVGCSMKSSQEKLEYLYQDYVQVVEEKRRLCEDCYNLEQSNRNLHADLEASHLQLQTAAEEKKRLSEECRTLEEANNYIHSELESFHHQLETARVDFESVSVENDLLRKQTESDHKTITSLQNERVKYLEEKSILKTIFQHLKDEISHVQELEGALAEMNDETNRLSEIAKYNKELGEKLRSEVEVRETTIKRLKGDMEEITNIHFDSEKDMCARLSEMEEIRCQLNEFLHKGQKQSEELDETKKRLADTATQKRLFQDIQKYERLALKGLLKNFKNIAKQRDALLQNVEKTTQENKELKLRLREQASLHQISTQELLKYREQHYQQQEKSSEDVRAVDETIKHLEKKYRTDMSRYQKKLRHLEKHMDKLQKAKTELEESNDYLKKTTQKLHSDLNDALEKYNDSKAQLNWKEVEKISLESELERCRREIEGLQRVDVLYNRSGAETNKAENEKDAVSSVPNSDARAEIEDLKEKIRNSEEKIRDREEKIRDCEEEIKDRGAKIAQLEDELQSVQKRIEEQEQILVHYENEIFRLSSNEKLTMEKYEDELMEDARILKTQAAERCEEREISSFTYSDGSVQAAEHPFQEDSNYSSTELVTIGNMTMPLSEVIEALQNEKIRYTQLQEAHEKLKWECKERDDAYVDEVKLHRETIQRMADIHDYMKVLEVERDDLANKLDMIMVEEEDNNTECIELSKENANLKNILERAKQKYVVLVGRHLMLEAELKHQFNLKTLSDQEHEELGEQLKRSENTIEELKKDLESAQQALYNLKEEYYKMQQQVTGLEFKNCELTLELHETQGKLKTEQRLNDELKQERRNRNSSPDGSFSSRS